MFYFQLSTGRTIGVFASSLVLGAWTLNKYLAKFNRPGNFVEVPTHPEESILLLKHSDYEQQEE